MPRRWIRWGLGGESEVVGSGMIVSMELEGHLRRKSWLLDRATE